MKKQTIAIFLATGLVVGSTSTLAAPKWADSGDTIVKCKGIAKMGANDCGANGHDCANQATKDNDPNEWVYVPEGVCEKIAGGSIFKKKVVK